MHTIQRYKSRLVSAASVAHGKRTFWSGGLHLTIRRFDIFRIAKDGGVFWIGNADDVHEAQELVTQNPSRSKEFLLFDLKTGTKMALKAGGSDGQGQHFAGG